MKFILASLLTSVLWMQTAQAETIVCTGAMKVNGEISAIALNHTPIDIDQVIPPEDYDRNGNFQGHPLVAETTDFKITAKRSVNMTQDVVLEVWSVPRARRLYWAAGVDHVLLGFQSATDDQTYTNINCYTSPAWKEMNARICAGQPAGSVKDYCDSLSEDRARNFPE